MTLVAHSPIEKLRQAPDDAGCVRSYSYAESCPRKNPQLIEMISCISAWVSITLSVAEMYFQIAKISLVAKALTH